MKHKYLTFGMVPPLFAVRSIDDRLRTVVGTRPIFTMIRLPSRQTTSAWYCQYHTLVVPIPRFGTCPDHPENNVKYHYGGINSSHNRIGRLMLREDGSGAIEYYYGKMGEVLKTVRTLIVPNQAVATYVTQWKYDSHNRLLEMIYPDEEKITYSYNLGGQVDHVRGYKSYGYDYVNKIGYDKFEQRTYLKYCNGAETFYSYDPARRRLQNLVVNAKAGTIMDNAYSYDAVSNVLGIKNNAPLPQRGKAGGQMNHSYTYDPLYRLASATGTYKGTDNKAASYTLSMGYDNMHRITSKKQHLSQTGVQFEGTLNAGYELAYTYGKDAGRKFQLDNVRDINYRTEETPTESTNINNGHKYEYDANGNLVYINTSRVKKDGKEDEKAGEQKYKWDEENRLLAANENGFVSNYWYDTDGERTVKSSGENEEIYVNSEFSGGRTNTAKFSLYVSPYLVASQGGRYTKHIYIGSQRIVSKLGNLASYGADPRRIPYAGNEADGITVDYKAKYALQQQSIKDNYKDFGVAYNGEDNDDYVNGRGFCCNDGSLEAAQAKAMTRSAIDGNFKPNDDYEKMQFYYHPDHLGSSSYITNLDGEVAQHIEYVPFGEVFIEERNNTWNTPYLFNAKEFDEETGMYYYGARYYEPRLSLWMSVDPQWERFPHMSSYSYSFNNPIKFIDNEGHEPITAVVDAMTAFVVEAGLDFVGNLVLKNMSPQQALNSINWGSATGAAIQSYAISLVISGAGSVKALKKAMESPLGRVAINFISSVTNSLIQDYKDGAFKDSKGNFSFVKLRNKMLPIMGEALVSALVSEGFTNKAKQIEAKLEKLHSVMDNQKKKLERNLARNASNRVISNRMRKVNNAQRAYLKELGKSTVWSGFQQGTSGTVGKGMGTILK